MKKSVLEIASVLFTKNMAAAKKKSFLMLAAMSLCFLASAQTYTTKAAGNWSSPSIWVGGLVPSRTIAAGMTVNILHKVTCDVTGDITISGVLNISGDTLRFASSFDKKTIINATGSLFVKNGGYIQDATANKAEMNINNGRLVLESAKMIISKKMIATGGARRSYTNSSLLLGENYEADGTPTSRAIDTIKNSTIETGAAANGIFDLRANTTLRVANARIIVNGDFKTENSTDISVLAGATSNYGFNYLKVKKDLENKGAWDARIDAYCIDGDIKGSNMAAIDFTRAEDCSAASANGNTNQAAPELVFMNPVLKSGIANKQGAVYRFSNVTTGVDAEVTLKKFSRNDIVMQSVDLSGLGWEKAFQPQFGLPGLVQPNQNWYVDFEMNFYKAGTNTKQVMSKVDLTALDVDGDGWSISEYATFETPSNIIYSTVSYLSGQPAGLLGQSFVCPIDNISSALIACATCGGDGKTGLWNLTECTVCDGSGLLFNQCHHAYEEVNGTSIIGPVENFVNIDTLATQVMTTYQYVDKDKIKFRYGATSGANASNGSGIRLNSVWFRQFSMTPPSVLPVRLANFTATLEKSNDVNLSWTGLEENFSHYILQRSADGKEYKDIAIVFATGNGQSNYKYKDANVSASTGTAFYRLVMVDKTKEAGKTSEVRVVRLGKEQAALQITAFPNPVKDQVRLSLPAAWQNKPALIELYTVNGTRVKQVQLGSASQTENLSIGSLQKGLYVVKVTCNGETAQQRIVKD